MAKLKIMKIESAIKKINYTIIKLHGIKEVEEIRDDLCDKRFQLEQKLAKFKKEVSNE